MKSRVFGRIFSIVLALCLMFTALPMFVFAAEEETERLYSPISAAEQVGGIVTPTMDLSYLAASYSATAGRARAVVPSSYDLRTYGRVSAVEDQGQYGTCWAFSALMSAESSLLDEDPTVALSARHLAWFTYTGAEEEEFALVLGDDADASPYRRGGNDSLAVGTLAAWKGAVSEETVPYNGEAVDESLRYAADYHLQDAFFLPNGALPEDQTAWAAIVKQILLENGAVTLSYHADGEATYYNAETFAWYDDSGAAADHGVTVIGWDDNYPRENFNAAHRPSADGAWLVMNSWGEDFGDGGCFWLSYEDTTVEFGCFYGMESAENYARNYQYDTIGWALSLALSASKVNGMYTDYGANVFTAAATEQIEAVAFYTTDIGTEYEVRVYTDLKDPTVPTSGTLMATQSGTEQWAGYHTIELASAVSVTAGSRFSVVVKFSNPNYVYSIPLECSMLPADYGEPVAMGYGGESYISHNGRTWDDAADILQESEDLNVYINNVCIKAFANEPAHVSFSIPEGEIALGQELTLSALGTDAIYYTTDGTDPVEYGILYTAPITVDREMTVSAVAKRGSTYGTVATHTYTQAASTVTTLAVDTGGGWSYVDLSGGETVFPIWVATEVTELRLLVQGGGTLTVNGEAVTSGEPYTLTGLGSGETVCTVRSEESGKKTVEYRIEITQTVLTYDYRAETVRFNESLFRVTAPDGTELSSGDSVSVYITNEGEEPMLLTVTEIASGDAFDDRIPSRPVAHVSEIDFAAEQTVSLYGEWNEVATSPDMADAVIWDRTAIPLTPGQNVYIRKYATDTSFASEIAVIEVPARPTPPNMTVDFAAETTAQPVSETVLYARTPDMAEAVAGEGAPLALVPGETLYFMYKATAGAFASEVAPLVVPARPDAPTEAMLAVEKVGFDKIALIRTEGCEYALDGGTWQTSPEFAGIAPQTEYTVSVRIAATESAFASDARSVTATTLSRLPGDLDGDGDVSNRDATMLLRYLAGWTSVAEIPVSEGDFNQNGAVDNRDATILLRYLARWQGVTLG